MHLPARSQAMKLERAVNYEPSPDMHTSQRFHNHFVIAKTLGGYYQGYNLWVSQDAD
jgi:hypothetical protein